MGRRRPDLENLATLVGPAKLVAAPETGETGLPEQMVSEGCDDYSHLRADVPNP